MNVFPSWIDKMINKMFTKIARAHNIGNKLHKVEHLTWLNIFNFQRSGEHDIDIIDLLHLFTPAPCVPTTHIVSRSIKEWVSFFLGSWGMNRSTGQTNRVNREAVLGRFVCSALRFIPHEPRKKTLIPYIYNASNEGPFRKFSEKNYKLKIPTVTGS